MTAMREKAVAGISVGDRFRISRTFTEPEMSTFADISKDYNPVHFDDRFAAVKRFSGRICHGLMVANLVTEIGGQVGWLATEMGFKFIKPVYFGDTVTCDLVVTAIGENLLARAEAVFINQHGETVLTGFLKGRLPGDAEKKIMRQMMDAGDPTNRIGSGA